MWAWAVWRQGWLIMGLAGLMALSGEVRADAAADWLDRAATAARQQNYSGVYVYHHGEHVEVLRVLHSAGPNGERAKIEIMDGSSRQFLRVNNDVYCHLPDGKHVQLERNALRRFFPDLLPTQPASLLDFYEARLGGTERIAGRPCQVVSLAPRDGYRYAYDLWLDKGTGLPLKARVVNDNGSVISMFVFSEVQIGKAPEIRNDMAGKIVQRIQADKPVVSAWSVTPPPGYEQVQEAVRALPGKSAPVTHMVFSDGLSVLSMFVEPADPRVQTLHGLSAEGAIGIYARQVDGYVVTTLGEVPNMALIETGNSATRK
ncbi:MAG: MucB/RseB C-terminal domain-containing protein [Betaproteobacteria bacterium]|nr:MucB/RseB C-terminal domain-containing protein [Betaproteobacteria bacterium]